MKLYLDLLFLLNFFFDFLLLLTTSMILRRNTQIKRIFLGSFVGALSIFLLFLPFPSFLFFIIKLVISIIMVLITFGFRDIHYTIRNLYYLYSVSILLGGFLYLLNVEFSYKQEGLVFYHHGLGINVVVLFVLAPLILYTYIKQTRKLKYHYSNYYNVDIYLKDGTIQNFTAFLDTGNQLFDPYLRRPIILVCEKDLPFQFDLSASLLVPYHGVNDSGLLKCIIPDYIYIYGVGKKDHVLVGIAHDKIDIDGVNCILHTKLLEG